MVSWKKEKKENHGSLFCWVNRRTIVDSHVQIFMLEVLNLYISKHVTVYRFYFNNPNFCILVLMIDIVCSTLQGWTMGEGDDIQKGRRLKQPFYGLHTKIGLLAIFLPLLPKCHYVRNFLRTQLKDKKRSGQFSFKKKLFLIWVRNADLGP